MNGDTVANVIEVNPARIPQVYQDAPVAPDGVGVGWSWDGSAYVPPPDPTETLANKRAQIDEERIRRIEAGASFAIAGVTDPIPLTGRPFDQTVYLALLNRAGGYRAAGVTDPILRIRAADDVIHMLTPDQMIELISKSMTWFESVMAASWAMKDGAAPFEAGIPDDLSNDAHWPDTGGTP
ncbi:MAG: hypothetical protein LC676_10655 [Loktanella sp.]|nr:hypothetical protein [Loktanella sp.]